MWMEGWKNKIIYNKAPNIVEMDCILIINFGNVQLSKRIINRVWQRWISHTTILLNTILPILYRYGPTFGRLIPPLWLRILEAYTSRSLMSPVCFLLYCFSDLFCRTTIYLGRLSLVLSRLSIESTNSQTWAKTFHQEDLYTPCDPAKVLRYSPRQMNASRPATSNSSAPAAPRYKSHATLCELLMATGGSQP